MCLSSRSLAGVEKKNINPTPVFGLQHTDDRAFDGFTWGYPAVPTYRYLPGHGPEELMLYILP